VLDLNRAAMSDAVFFEGLLSVEDFSVSCPVDGGRVRRAMISMRKLHCVTDLRVLV